MKAKKRAVRKPGPFKVHHVLLMSCETLKHGKRHVVFETNRRTFINKSIPRLSTWLAKAAVWVEAGERK